MIETFRGTVYPWQCDFFNHLNVQFYLGKFDEACWQYYGHVGMSPDYFRETERGMVAMEQRVRYYKELRGGDLLYIQTELKEVRAGSMKLRHIMYNASTNDAVAEMEIIGIHRNSRTRSSCTFPAEVRARLDLIMNS